MELDKCARCKAILTQQEYRAKIREKGTNWYCTLCYAGYQEHIKNLDKCVKECIAIIENYFPDPYNRDKETIPLMIRWEMATKGLIKYHG